MDYGPGLRPTHGISDHRRVGSSRINVGFADHSTVNHRLKSRWMTGEAMRLYRKIREVVWRVSMIGLARGPHITRYFMYDRLGSIGPLLPHRTGRSEER